MKAINPRTGEADYAFDEDSPGAVAEAAARLRSLQPEWEARGPEGRAAILQAFADALERHAAPIVAALEVDTGRTAIARVELESVARRARGWAMRGPQVFAGLPRDATPSATPGFTIEPRWSAYPLFGAIAPWNFPLLLSHIDALPALAAGCAALIKPSEVTPRFVEPLRAALAEVPELPLAYVMGGAETGQALIASVDYVCFTGSTATGRKVAETAARALIPANLELGGKDPMIVTASADPVHAAQVALRASVVATGQGCQSIERVYVARAIFQPFLAALVEAAEAVETTGADPTRGHLGPFIFPAQAAKVAAQIDDARARGATIHTGGEIETQGGGRYMRPTVLTGLTDEMALMREETFGPVIPVIPFDTVEEAIALANAGDYGLSASVIAGDAEEAAAIGERIDAGAISLQDGALTTMVGDATNHSRKGSGLGPSRMGDEGMLRFLRRQALIRQTGTPATIEMFREGPAQ
ncbi:Putative succinate-semialdehyde dehydrogenase [NADP(+)] 2 [Tsuneonella dongtanensis]|uniref:Putative succinate-semialdehyde dehydrogenase [NADP(+)] 2 n=1 Tax=Tsuneonella dongtanensis TaxID=692370 RepID=A0A1B2AGG3_9SPHN|nr:aldehyde dehydrogenase family protein [Tsuneonella dongtanensis]ANY21115.1 Putative succinate-semialdehyde dehydrogenase [NADP(+)] 2 [Tsuneonella dongtanensis]